MSEPCNEGQGIEKRVLRVLELYAGIGGMHCALNRCFDFSRIDKSSEGRDVQQQQRDIPFTGFEVVAAVDVNEVAASVYKHNFPSINYLRKGVEGFTLCELEALRFDMVTMSPPCQPFTRQGLKMDEEDARTKSFFHFLSLLKKMAERGTAPNYVVVENVLGFETSATHQTLVETLDRCGFCWRELLLTPTQFGIPNSRLRYYLVGRRGGGGGGEEAAAASKASVMKEEKGTTTEHPEKDNSLTFSLSNDHSLGGGGGEEEAAATTKSAVIKEKVTSTEHPDRYKTLTFYLSNDHSHSPLREVPIEAEAFRHHRTLSELKLSDLPPNSSEPAQKRLKNEEKGNDECNDVDPISDFIISSETEGNKSLLVPDKVLKRFMVMDVTFPYSRRSCCFTKAYGHYVDGTGSFLQLNQSGPTRDSVYEIIKKAHSLEEAEDDQSSDKKSIKLDSLTDADISLLRELKLRYFSSTEIARLHCLSGNFGFPDSVSQKQRWKVLGNGLNAHVVAVLMRLLLLGH